MCDSKFFRIFFFLPSNNNVRSYSNYVRTTSLVDVRDNIYFGRPWVLPRNTRGDFGYNPKSLTLTHARTPINNIVKHHELRSLVGRSETRDGRL